MKYRSLDSNGDYVIGRGQSEFLANSPEAVAQAVRTRLGLWRGQWWLDLTVGLPLDEIVGAHTVGLYDAVIQEYILDTTAVTAITKYQSTLTPSRELDVSATINTFYGVANVSATLSVKT